MNWIFQAIPKRYDLRTALRKDATETWLVTRYRDEMKAKDRVFFWLAGPKDIRGIYGFGRIIDSEPKFHENWGYGIAVKYEYVLPSRLAYDDIQNLEEMNSHLIYRSAVGTNFKLEDNQAKAIFELIRERFGEEAYTYA